MLSDASKLFNAKLATKFDGPFTIVEKKSPTAYILDSKERGSKLLGNDPYFRAQALCLSMQGQFEK